MTQLIITPGYEYKPFKYKGCVGWAEWPLDRLDWKSIFSMIRQDIDKAYKGTAKSGYTWDTKLDTYWKWSKK